jgi:prophage DNA circulation protein
MPSLETIANEVKGIVTDIKADTSQIKTNTNSIKSDAGAIKTNTATIINEINQLDNDLKAGFTNLSQGLQVLITLGLQANQLLAENNKQNETIICWLTNIANTLCEIKRNTDKEVKLQKDLSATLHHIDDIGELVNGREAMEVANRYELEARMDKCCPPKEEPEVPCFEKCESPKRGQFEPIKSDWKPIKFNDSKPIG